MMLNVKKSKAVVFLLLCAAMVITQSCHTLKWYQKHYPQTTTEKSDTDSISEVDSAVVKTVTIIQPPDSADIVARLRCDSLGNVYIQEISTLQGKNIKLQSYLKNNVFTAKAKIDSSEIALTYIEHHKSKFESKVIKEKSTVTLPPKVVKAPLTWWEKFCLTATPILLALIGIWLFLKIKKIWL